VTTATTTAELAKVVVPRLDSSTDPTSGNAFELSEATHDFLINLNSFDEPWAFSRGVPHTMSSNTSLQVLTSASHTLHYATPSFVIIGSYGGNKPTNELVTFIGKRKLADVLATGALLTPNAITAPFTVWSFADTLLGALAGDPLEGFAAYRQANWDGFDAEAITSKTLEAARRIIDMLPPPFGTPDIAPGADGTIGFEWLPEDRPFVKLYIDVGPGRIWRAYWRRRDGQRGELPPEAITLNTKSRVERLLSELSA
jgi:hypothetical protein